MIYDQLYILKSMHPDEFFTGSFHNLYAIFKTSFSKYSWCTTDITCTTAWAVTHANPWEPTTVTETTNTPLIPSRLLGPLSTPPCHPPPSSHGPIPLKITLDFLELKKKLKKPKHSFNMYSYLLNNTSLNCGSTDRWIFFSIANAEVLQDLWLGESTDAEPQIWRIWGTGGTLDMQGWLEAICRFLTNPCVVQGSAGYWICLLSLNSMVLRFSHLGACIRTSFFFMAK